MRLVLLALVLSTRFAAAQPAPSDAEHTSRLEGRILSTTGEPVRKATVLLGNDSVSYFDTSDNDGKVLFENIQPGSYTLSARKTGFVGMYETAPYILVPGQSLKDIVMRLPKQAAISGRVVDQDGDPISGADVRALRWDYVDGQRLLFPASGANTDSQGGFLVNDLRPGRYYLLVVDHPDNLPRGIPGRSGPIRLTVSTFYPSELDVPAAVPLDLAAGSELPGITIRVRSERVYSIRGKVTGFSATELARSPQMQITRTGDKTVSWVRLPMSVGIRPPDGTFESPHLSPGTYMLQTGSEALGGSDRERAPRTGRLEVTIRDSDVEGAVLELRPAVQIEITGTVNVEGSDPSVMVVPAAPSQLGQSVVELWELEGLNKYRGGIQPKDDGTFRFGKLEPARYRVGVRAIPEDLYLKSVRFGDQDVIGTTLNLTSGVGGAIQIVLSKNPSSVSGTVQDRTRDTQGAVVVALWPVTSEPGALDDGFRWVFEGRQREFQFKGLAPGEYYLTSWEQGPGSSLVYSPDFRTRVQREASKITLQEGSRETVEVKLLPQDEVAAEEAKLR